MKEAEKYLFLKAEILAEIKKVQSNLQLGLKNPQNDWGYQEQIVKAQSKIEILNHLKALINYLDNNQVIRKYNQSVQRLERCYNLPPRQSTTPEKE
ncbi:hypothetical protein [Laspinema palackyanum]|uniref:hypothetical protein n=1 Tax=Laspinema palackyanum TaxID=3231601 RepID=UPI00345D6D69|nr:hypothetical protein [Laspinema sp. D2c]